MRRTNKFLLEKTWVFRENKQIKKFVIILFVKLQRSFYLFHGLGERIYGSLISPKLLFLVK